MAVDYRNYLPFAEDHEGKVPWMYLDTVGKVTVGIGHLIATADDAVALPFVDPQTGTAAAEAAIRAAFAVVQGAPYGNDRAAGAFAGLTTIRLTEDGMEQVFAADYETIVGRTRTLFQAVGGGLDSYPDPAQLAVVDMAFNLGAGGLYDKFPSFRTKGLDPRAFDVAAQQSHRRGISEARNQWTYDQLMAAARIEAPQA